MRHAAQAKAARGHGIGQAVAFMKAAHTGRGAGTATAGQREYQIETR
jgi:hypothetical protein